MFDKTAPDLLEAREKATHSDLFNVCDSFYSPGLRQLPIRPHVISRRTPGVLMVVARSPVNGRCIVRDNAVVPLESAPNGGCKPAGSGEHVRQVHVLEVRLRITPGNV